ncbi:MAG: SDR family oxidoreductase [Pirellulaceae bacterium]|nr:SDR family oxidoreductase [Pirellulaceae bacterium]
MDPHKDARPLNKVRRILITGGAGFLGSHLCDRLVEEGHDVICLDNFFTSQKTNVSHLLGRPNFELIRHDVTQPIWLEVDRIYNLACPAAPGHYQFNPIKTMKTSVMGAINLLGMALRCRARILQASTSEVYGDPEIHPQPESYRGSVNPIGPRACYDEGKRAAETLFMDYHRMNQVDIRLIRIFNTYGPRMHPFDGRVVSNFIRQALAGQDIVIYGDGQQTRSFCHCDDLVNGIIRMMEGPADFIGPVNLGNPMEFTIRELAELTIELTSSKSKLIHAPLPADDPTRRQPDITLAKTTLGWEPKIELREGLGKTIEWFRTINLDAFRPPTPNY